MQKLSLGKKFLLYFLCGIFITILLMAAFVYYIISPDVFNNEQATRQEAFNNVSLKVEMVVKTKIEDVENFKNKVSNVKNEEIKQAIEAKIQEIKGNENIFIFNENNVLYGNLNKQSNEANILKNHINPLKTIVTIQNDNIYIVVPTKVNKEIAYIGYKIGNGFFNELLATEKNILLRDTNSNLVLISKNNDIINTTDIINATNENKAYNSNIIQYNKNVSLLKAISNCGIDVIKVFPKDAFYAESHKFINTLIYILIIYILLVALLFGILLYILNNSTNKISRWIKAVKEDDLDFVINISPLNVFSEIAQGFKDMIERLKRSNKELEKQAEELYDRNWQVEEANKELEDSYQKLQETINQLNEAEEKYYSLVKNLPEIVCVIELDGTIVFINDMAKDILGYDKEELINEKVNLLLDQKTGKNLLNITNKKLKKQPKVIAEIPLKKKDGTIIIAEAKITQHFSKGSVDGIQAIIRDITKNKKLQKEIIHKNEELLTIYNISKSLSSTIELDNVFNLIVNEVCKLLNADLCMLRTLDFTGKNLIMRAYSGKYFEDIKEEELKEFVVISSTKVPNAVYKKEMVELDEFDSSWSIGQLNSKKAEKDKIKQGIFMPICAKDRILGLIVVGSTTRINEVRLKILNSIANNAAVALENATLYENSKKYFIKTIDALIAAVEAKDKYTEGHSRRVSKYVEIMGRMLGLSKEKIEDIKIAGILHDVGKIGISDNILLKPGRLTDEEYEEIKQHPIISNRILYSVGLSETTMKAIACHHERYDGQGYPFGLKEDELSIECQIIAVADALDAMTSNRSYRRALTFDEAIKEIIRNKGAQFGPEVVEAVIQIYESEKEKLLAVQERVDIIS